MRRIIFCFVILFVCWVPHTEAAPLRWYDRLEEYQLANGMKFILLPWGESPTFSVYIRMRVGGLDEDPGETGLAHFLEHMAFKGTRQIGTKNYAQEEPILKAMDEVGEKLAAEIKKGQGADQQKIKSHRDELKKLRQQQEPLIVREEISRLLLENGAQDINATTSKDMTSYFISLPSDKIAFWANIDSERIFYPIFREFYEERDVILEERRMRVDNDPDGKLYQELIAQAFVKSPYRWPTIGVAEDLMTLTRPTLEKFWRRYYVPENAVGVIVGKFDTAQVKKLLEETFGKVPASPLKRNPIASDLPQTAERRFVLHAPGKERMTMVYHKPTLPDDDDYLFDLLNEIVANGRSTRLYKSLILNKRIASGVNSYTGAPGSKLPNLFMISVTPLQGHDSEECLKAIDEEILRIQQEGVSEPELTGAKNRILADMIWKMESNDGMAEHISYFEGIGSSWKYLRDYEQVIQRFSTEDIKRLAQKYLVPSNRTIGILKP